MFMSFIQQRQLNSFGDRLSFLLFIIAMNEINFHFLLSQDNDEWWLQRKEAGTIKEDNEEHPNLLREFIYLSISTKIK